MTFRKIEPATALRIFSCVLAALYAGWVAWYADAHSTFSGDDIVWLFRGRTVPLASFLWIPIDVHVVPLHHLVSLFVGSITPVTFARAVAVMTVFHLLSVLLLYRALEELRPSVANAVVSAWYGTHVYLGAVFLWWTSALHRLPFLCFLALSVLCYARFRRTRSLRAALGTVLAWVLAAGFFEKAAIIPLVLVGIELSLWDRTERRDRARHLAFLGVLLGLLVGYLLLWRRVVGPEWAVLSTAPAFLLAHARSSWAMLLRSTIGETYGGLGVAIVLWVAIVLATVARARFTLVLWACAVGLVTLSLVSTGLSAPRSQMYGQVLSMFGHRYYTDVMFVLMLFTGIALSRGASPAAGASPPLATPEENSRLTSSVSRSVPPGEPVNQGLGRAKAGLVAAALLAQSVLSVTSAARLMGVAADHLTIKRYMDKVTRGIADLEAHHIPVVLLDGHLPKRVDAYGGQYARHSVVLRALGIEAQMMSERKPGVFEITDTGDIVPTWGRR